MMQQILIIEDDKALNLGLSKALKADDKQIVSAKNLKEAREQLLCGAPALILLDINLPDGSGLSFLQEIRQKDMPDVPVILLTANDTDMDIVNGLELGADDYITKPFSLAVLRARVNTQLKKAEKLLKNAGGKDNVYRTEAYEFNFDRMEFLVDGNAVELSKTEQKLLRLFVENEGITLRRELLLEKIWSDGAEYVDENALSVSVKRLRDKLNAKETIKTIYGIGYRWEKEICS